MMAEIVTKREEASTSTATDETVSTLEESYTPEGKDRNVSMFMNIDDDVESENIRINNLTKQELAEHNLVIKNLTKYYKNLLAVNNINLSVNAYECFGLLGVNGAGKTSTFKILTGDQKMTSGEAWIKGHNIVSDINRVYDDIGYCPQYDALLDELTGREMLKLIAILRGIPKRYIDELSEELTLELNFLQHIDKRTANFSGGNKRKLSVALATLGNPSVLFLDEPTTGMDPGARRQLWDVICRMRDNGKTIVLTSHSMEECEALCTRLVIMVNGTFKCLGSTQHIKNKFSQGFVLTIKMIPSAEYTAWKNEFSSFSRRSKRKPRKRVSLKSMISTGFLALATSVQRFTGNLSRAFSSTCKRRNKSKTVAAETEKVADFIDPNADKIKQFVKEKFVNCRFQEEYCNMLKFYISPTNIKWSYFLGEMEEAKVELKDIMESYLIEPITLEHVFLSFTKYQMLESGRNKSNSQF